VIDTAADVATDNPFVTPFAVIGPFIEIRLGESIKNIFPLVGAPSYLATTNIVRGVPYVDKDDVAPILHAKFALVVKNAGYDELKAVADQKYPEVGLTTVVVMALLKTLLSITAVTTLFPFIVKESLSAESIHMIQPEIVLGSNSHIFFETGSKIDAII
jgi:hypothetical protein